MRLCIIIFNSVRIGYIFLCSVYREINLKVKPVGENWSSARQPVKTANRLK